MNRRTSHIATLLLAIWALVWGVNVGHEWSHHGDFHETCLHAEHPEQAPVDGAHVQHPEDESDCAVCDWDWGPVRTAPPVSPHLVQGMFALRLDFPRVDTGHPSAWLANTHGRRGPPEAR